MNSWELAYMDDTIEAIDAGWCKDMAEDEYGNVCLVGAAMRATSAAEWAGRPVSYAKWLDRVGKAVLELFPDRAIDPNSYIPPGYDIKTGDIPHFNDHEQTTKEDVLLVLKHAREMD